MRELKARVALPGTPGQRETLPRFAAPRTHADAFWSMDRCARGAECRAHLTDLRFSHAGPREDSRRRGELVRGGRCIGNDHSYEKSDCYPSYVESDMGSSATRVFATRSPSLWFSGFFLATMNATSPKNPPR